MEEVVSLHVLNSIPHLTRPYSMLRDIKTLREALFGEKKTRREHRAVIDRPLNIRRALNRLPKTDGQEDKERPIFLLSAGWRSGSTLLQRLLLSDQETLIWGEPYSYCGLVQRLSDSVLAFDSSWPPADFFFAPDKDRDLARSWTANLYPTLPHLRAAHREFFIKLFAEPAYAAGYTRWGLKEVRFNACHAAYLRWLFPLGKFVFLIRDPYAAYRSYRARGRNWYATWPFRPVFTPHAFGTHWRTLASDFIEMAKKGMGYLIYYEALENQTIDLTAVEEYVDCAVDRSVLDHAIGSWKTGRTERQWTPKVELMLLRRAVSPLAGELGYHL